MKNKLDLKVSQNVQTKQSRNRIQAGLIIFNNTNNQRKIEGQKKTQDFRCQVLFRCFQLKLRYIWKCLVLFSAISLNTQGLIYGNESMFFRRNNYVVYVYLPV